MTSAAGDAIGSPAGQGAQPQAGSDTGNANLTPAANPQAGTDAPAEANQAEETISLEKARELRRENATKTARLKELEAWKTEREQADMTDLEREKAGRAAAEAKATKAQERLVLRELSDAARKLGIIDPEFVSEQVKSRLEYDDDGAPTNAESLFRELLRKMPYLANTASVNGAPANPARDGASGQQIFTRAQLEDLDFYAKNQVAIKQAMREGRIAN